MFQRTVFLFCSLAITNPMQKYHVHNHIPITTQLYLIGLNIELKHHKKGGKKKKKRGSLIAWQNWPKSHITFSTLSFQNYCGLWRKIHHIPFFICFAISQMNCSSFSKAPGKVYASPFSWPKSKGVSTWSTVNLPQ